MFSLKIAIERRLSSITLKATVGLIAAAGLYVGPALAAPPDTMPIWRAQVRFVTANLDWADTGDAVNVQLNNLNRTWLSSGWGDRYRNSNQTFDLTLDGINTMADIDFFRVEKSASDDGWGIQAMYLIINEEVIYQLEPSQPLWLGTDNGHSLIYVIDDSLMRPQAAWVNYLVPSKPTVVPVWAMQSRIDSIAGDFATQNHFANDGQADNGLLMAKFGTAPVEMHPISTTAWNVDIDLEADGWFDMDIDLNFDLRASCSNGRPDFIVSNTSVSSLFDWPSADSAGSIPGFISAHLNEMMKNFTYVPYQSCPGIVLSPSGDLIFNPLFNYGDILQSTEFISGLVGMRARVGESVKGFGDTRFVATVSSNLDKSAPMIFSFNLSSQIVPSDAIVEVGSGKDQRTINARYSTAKDGTGLIEFKDELPPGQNVEYALHLIFRPKQDEREQIITSIRPSARDLSATITPLTATTSFAVKGGEVVPMGTQVTQAAYIDGKGTIAPTKPANPPPKGTLIGAK